MDHPSNPLPPIALPEHRVGSWQKLGGNSLMIAVVIHIIAIMAGAIWIFQITRVPDVPNIPISRGDPSQSGTDKTAGRKNRQQIASATRVYASDTIADVTLPDLSDDFGKMAAMTPMGTGGLAGSLIGDGSGSLLRGNRPGPGPIGLERDKGVKLFDMIPPVLGKRCSRDDRLQRLKENGGTPECEEAVLKGLRWIKANQSADGSFGNGNVAMTGLALLAYFGHCETPNSEEFGDSCMKAIVVLGDFRWEFL